MESVCNSPPVRCGLFLMTSRDESVDGVNRITLHLGKPEKHDYSQESKICFTDLNVCSYYVLLIRLDKNGILWFSAITHNTSSITRKTSDKPN